MMAPGAYAAPNPGQLPPAPPLPSMYEMCLQPAKLKSTFSLLTPMLIRSIHYKVHDNPTQESVIKKNVTG